MAEEKEKKTAAPGGGKFACGCMVVIIFLLMLVSFIAGARYGKDFVDSTIDFCYRVYYTAKDSADDVRDNAGESIDKINEDYKNISNEK